MRGWTFQGRRRGALTHIRFRPWLEQIVTRATRIDPSVGPYETQRALVLHPNDPLFQRFRIRMETEQGMLARPRMPVRNQTTLPFWVAEELGPAKLLDRVSPYRTLHSHMDSQLDFDFREHVFAKLTFVKRRISSKVSYAPSSKDRGIAAIPATAPKGGNVKSEPRQGTASVIEGDERAKDFLTAADLAALFEAAKAARHGTRDHLLLLKTFRLR